MNIILRWLINTLAIMITAYVVPGIEIVSVYIGLIVSIIIGLLNAIVRPILIFLTLPITIVTLGLFILVINGLLFWFTASFVDGLTISGFLSAIVGALLVSVISGIGNRVILDSKDSIKKDNTLY